MNDIPDMPTLYKYLTSPDIPGWPTRKRGVSKPVGLWLSVGDAWERWCMRENIFLDRVAWRRPVTIRHDARVLVMNNLSAEFEDFTQRYADPADEFRVPVWDRVASDLDILVLWPWEWPVVSDHYRWDQAWDCPSGVVLRPGMISYGSAEARSAVPAG